jgi:hypothetical protein
MSTNETTWSELLVQQEPFPTLAYRTAMNVYEESLIRGRLVGHAWSGAGFANASEEGCGLIPTNTQPRKRSGWKSMVSCWLPTGNGLVWSSSKKPVVCIRF